MLFHIILSILATTFVESANILCVIPFSSYSHYVSLKPIGLELSRRGHNVTVITKYKEKNPPLNYHEIMVDDKFFWDLLGGEPPNIFTMADVSAEEFNQEILWKGGLGYTELVLNSTDVQLFLQQDNSFDLVLCEIFFQEALMALSHKYNAPLVLMTTVRACMKHNIITRNPLQLATIVAEYLGVNNPTGFLGRLRNFYFSMNDYVLWRYWYMEKQENLVKKYLPEVAKTMPSLLDIEKNASLTFVNRHFSFDTSQALLPNVIEIGGIHLNQNKEFLPEDLQSLLNNAPKGVIYMNFGSNVRSSELPEVKRKAFLKVFKKLNYTVLWKWEEDELSDKPDNVEIRKWLPQKAILAHPNVKVFISHGGYIGTQEAIYNGVPLVGVPVYGDQYMNLLTVEERGMGKFLSYHDITEESLEKVLTEVLYNNSYRYTAKYIAQKFKDRPMNPLDTAVYWIEYVIRYKGADHMKNPAIPLSWMAYNMFDLFHIILSILATTFVESANILCVIPFSSYSHYVSLKPIGLELSRRGHNVTVITKYKEKNPPLNYHEIMVDDKIFWDLLGGEPPNIFTMADVSAEEFNQEILWKGGLGYTELVLNSTDVQLFLQQDNSFDLVLCEIFFQEALMALSHKYNAPLVLMTTVRACMKHNIITRNPLQLATIVAEYLGVNNPTGFLGRLRNFYFSMNDYVLWRYWYMEKQENLVKKYLPEVAKTMPSLLDIEKNASLTFVNRHFSFDTSQALLPNVIEIGGIHLNQNKEFLPEDLQSLLNNAPKGVIYMNFGSNVRSSELPEVKRKAFLKVFKKLNYTVLWKWEEDELSDKPDNVEIRKWLPQKAILAHPNVKVFISHSGYIGTQEAIYNGVPLVGVPVYGDQYMNLLTVEERGMGKFLSYHDITEESLEKVLTEVLYNNSYRYTAKYIAQKFKDRPMNPLDTAVYWIEYVIRYKGADHMKNPAIPLSWMAYNMFDVYIFLLLILVLLFMLSIKGSKIILGILVTRMVISKKQKLN